ncbi:putative Methylated-DNA--protein-cysteine methyltransferase [Trichophyton interdigitale]|uniref:Methylated-DNA--protein-cysteine methyltransferase n=1 Tax=Trichophyton interdigitale TaxID=101480 RepID=A0A9P5CZS7_9EURO|nr:putative Methylated-DNA--protein-cysteine methyltransferase [Trichophyton interdigitale]KAF3900790.1 putative Methylated-DNA--protein-cysteine methyltransferase [Trichophyton interdigitale]KAG8211688.1 putative Methylated-DNA--protein-cysteine methyltransferase [Trichophyton interdigitale]
MTAAATTRPKRKLSASGSRMTFGLQKKIILSSASMISQKPATAAEEDPEFLRKQLDRISSHPSLTPYRRRVYRTLLSVPKGQWTTYAMLSAHLSSSARAIGNAMKTNPFAPEVPCHRVLASNRTIGGYKGSWGNGGSYAVEKTKLLRGEGVVFDAKGRAGGEIFTQFADMGEVLEGKES